MNAADFVDAVAARPGLVLGVDPRPSLHGVDRSGASLHGDDLLAHIRHYTLDLIEALASKLAAVKPQLAFFEALGPDGYRLVHDLMTEIGRRGVPVIADAKRGDIGSTAEAYAEAFLAAHPGTALTVNAYLGEDAVQPFLVAAAAHRGAVFVLVKTSNPGSWLLQDLPLTDGRRVSDAVADWVATAAERHRVGAWSRVGAVVGATYPGEVARLRERMPHSLLLIPGVGAQGGTIVAGPGMLNSASRSLYYPGGRCDVAAAVAVADGYLADLAQP